MTRLAENYEPDARRLTAPALQIRFFFCRKYETLEVAAGRLKAMR